jgi:ATP-dependent helicase/nuclease subunit A
LAQPLASQPVLPPSNDLSETLEVLRKRIEWKYPFLPATLEPAKTSVSALRRRANETVDEEAADFYAISAGHLLKNEQLLSRNQISGTDRGSVHHTFLQFVSLERVGSKDELKAEAERLVRQKTLTGEEAALLDFDGLAAFWRSKPGERIRRQKTAVRRELRFTARLPAIEIAELVGEPVAGELANEFVIIQGVVDLAVVLAQEIWLVDFKTDSVKNHELADKTRFYEPQLKLYAGAMSQIYRRPVSEAWLYFLGLGEAVEIELIRNRVRAAV